jgi:hypothetical protein
VKKLQHSIKMQLGTFHPQPFDASFGNSKLFLAHKFFFSQKSFSLTHDKRHCLQVSVVPFDCIEDWFDVFKVSIKFQVNFAKFQ